MTKKTAVKKKQPLERHKSVLQKISANIGKGVSREQAVRDMGYSKSYARSGHIKDTRSWDVLLKEEMPDGLLMEVHKQLLNATHLNHEVFPTLKKIEKKGKLLVDVDPKSQLTDDDIHLYFEELGCRVRRIVHSEQARHVYFWSPDNQARDKALDKGYKLKSKYAPEEFNMKFKGFSKEQLINNIVAKIAKKK